MEKIKILKQVFSLYILFGHALFAKLEELCDQLRRFGYTAEIDALAVELHNQANRAASIIADQINWVAMKKFLADKENEDLYKAYLASHKLCVNVFRDDFNRIWLGILKITQMMRREGRLRNDVQMYRAQRLFQKLTSIASNVKQNESHFHLICIASQLVMEDIIRKYHSVPEIQATTANLIALIQKKIEEIFGSRLNDDRPDLSAHQSHNSTALSELDTLLDDLLLRDPLRNQLQKFKRTHLNDNSKRYAVSTRLSAIAMRPIESKNLD